MPAAFGIAENTVIAGMARSCPARMHGSKAGSLLRRVRLWFKRILPPDNQRPAGSRQAAAQGRISHNHRFSRTLLQMRQPEANPADFQHKFLN
ncbi:MAG: hypothetical protein C4531_04035 [Desulfurivibrio sp.]|nr:MAG: hypothetical protein C4531_04035 [Desulfurivibrio sp.]